MTAMCTIHPGDDFRLGFGLVDHREPADPDTEQNLIVSGYTSTEDFIAVYDRKALWRAASFTAERNMLFAEHPWTAAEGNEWYETMQDFFIPSYTWISNNIQNNAVAYDYDGSDTPMGFVSKLGEQARWNEQLSVNQAIAPNNNWHYYTRSVDHESVSNAEFNGTVNTTVSNLNGLALQIANLEALADEGDAAADIELPAVLATAPVNGEYPYLPGWTEWLRREDLFPTDPADESFLGRFAAGVDCVAFVMHAFGYDGSTSRWARDKQLFSPNDRTTAGGQARYYPYRITQDRGYAEVIADKNVLELVQINDEDKFIPENLDLIRPGDIVYYATEGEDDDGNPVDVGSHVMMVYSVEQPENGGPIQPEHVRLIESTHWDDGSSGFVTYDRLISAVPAIRDWVIFRLKQ